MTAVTVAIGGRAGRARIWVLPRLTALAIEGDSVIRIPEGAALTLRAAGSDARGNRIDPTGLAWNAGDAAVATIDSAGALRAVAPGMTTVTVAASGLAAERRIEVVPVPTSITLTAGGDQRAAAGQRLPGAVADPGGIAKRPPGAQRAACASTRPPAMGRLEPDTATTDARGLAESRWTLGPFPGRQRLAVEVPGIDSALVVTAEADPTPKNTHITLVTDSLVGEAGTALAAPVTVRATDSAGLALADVPVSWTALGGGVFSLTDTRTDSLGEARAHWRLGTKAGRQQAKVQLGNPRTLPPFAFSATAVPGAVASLVVVSGDAQRATVGTALAHAIVVRVADSLGNPVSGVPIRVKAQTGKADSMVSQREGWPGECPLDAGERGGPGAPGGPARLIGRQRRGDGDGPAGHPEDDLLCRGARQRDGRTDAAEDGAGHRQGPLRQPGAEGAGALRSGRRQDHAGAGHYGCLGPRLGHLDAGPEAREADSHGDGQVSRPAGHAHRGSRAGQEELSRAGYFIPARIPSIRCFCAGSVVIASAFR